MKRLTLATALAFLGAPALAGRPLVAETADALARGDCEVETSAIHATVRDGRSLRAGEGIFSCGVGGGTQVGIAYGRATGAETAEALQLAGKTTFVAPAAGATGWGLAYRATALKPEGGSFEGELFALVGLMTRDLGSDWLLHANLGLVRNRLVDETRIRWWLGVERIGTFFYAADLFGNDRGESFLSAGMGYAFSPAFSANVAFARQWGGGMARDMSVGLKFTH